MLAEYACLAREPRLACFVVAMQHLHGDRGLQQPVLGAVHLAGPASSEEADNREVADVRSVAHQRRRRVVGSVRKPV